MCFSLLILSRFQWVNLQIPYLNAMRFDEDIMDSLGKLPRTLKATYSQILASMREGTAREWAVTVRALMWMICSEIPLTQQLWAELTYWPNAVPTHGVTTLFELCHHLVTSNSQSKHVGFAHLSVREYLETEFKPEDSNSMAAECCLSILDSATDTVIPYRPSEWAPLTFYASRYWPVHLNSSYSGMEHMRSPLLDHLKRFLGSTAVPGPSYCGWMTMLCDSPYDADNVGGYILEDPQLNSLRYPSGDRKLNSFDWEVHSWRRNLCSHLAATPPNPLFLACYFKFGEKLPEMFACNELDIKSTNNEGHTLLHVACIGGNDSLVDILLNAGADPHFLISKCLATPLDFAFTGGNEGIVTRLLNTGANYGWFTNILVAAASHGAGMSVMTWLINEEPGIKITESVFIEIVETSKDWAGSLDLPRTLLARAPYIEINEAIAYALGWWWNDLTLVLLDRNPQTTITEAGLTVLIRSASRDLVRKLLAREPPIKITEAVMAAVVGAERMKDKAEILRMLLATDQHMKVTEAVVAAAAADEYHGEQAMRVLLARDPTFEITLPTVMRMPPRFSEGILLSMLARVPNIVITERLLLDNMHDNQSGENMMGILLTNFPGIPITEGPLLAATTYKGPRMMEILLASVTNIKITEAVVSAAVLNNWCGDKLMSILLNKDPTIKLPVALLTAAAMNTGCGKRLMEILLTTRPDTNIGKTIVSDEECNREDQDIANQGNQCGDYRCSCNSGGAESELRLWRVGGTSGLGLGYQIHRIGCRGGRFPFRLQHSDSCAAAGQSLGI